MIGLLGSLLGGKGGRMLGGLVGGRTGSMVGGLVGSLVGGRRIAGALKGLKGKVRNSREAQDKVSASLTDDDATILIKVMANSAKADGHVDQDEIDKILNEIQHVSEEEKSFLENELASEFIEADKLCAMVPEEISVEAYVAAIAAINIDNGQEVDYLKKLSEGLNISADDRNVIHDELNLEHL